VLPASRTRHLLTVAGLSAAAIVGALGPATGQGACHPSYRGACIPPDASDVDCYGGTGNGPYYVGRVVVVGPDVFRLDSDGNGVGCEESPPVPAGLGPQYIRASSV
jgi:hypothetical protein